jgi:CheY-specific phosphatase CheX
VEPGEIQAALESAVEEVLETMFFTAVLGSAAGPPPHESQRTATATGEKRDLTAELSFQGDLAGRVLISVSSNLARVIAASFLGSEEDDVSDSQTCEVICELANMICGSALSRLGLT